MTAPAVGANTSVRLTLYNATTGDSGRYDDVVVKEVTPATMYRVQRIAAPAYVEAKIWRTQFVQKGVCFYKDANNMILAYFGLDNKIEMIKRVAGTWSALLGSVTYSHTAGYAIRLTPNAGWTSFTVSANGVDKIGPISITDLAFTGTWYAGVFNTYDSGNIANDAFDDFTIVPV